MARGRSTKAAPVAGFGLQGERTECGHFPVGGESPHRGGDGLTLGPDAQIGFDRCKLRVAGEHDGPVVIERRLQRWFGKVQRRDLYLVPGGPVRLVSPDHRVAEEELC